MFSLETLTCAGLLDPSRFCRAVTPKPAISRQIRLGVNPFSFRSGVSLFTAAAAGCGAGSAEVQWQRPAPRAMYC